MGLEKILEDFKKFALRGNVVDLAIGVVIGAAFSGIVNSLVADVITPLIGAITGGLDFSNHFLPLSAKVTAASLEFRLDQGGDGRGCFSKSRISVSSCSCLESSGVFFASSLLIIRDMARITKKSTKATMVKFSTRVMKCPQANTAPCFFASSRLAAVTLAESGRK